MSEQPKVVLKKTSRKGIEIGTKVKQIRKPEVPIVVPQRKKSL
jgi:hypothetical protein